MLRRNVEKELKEYYLNKGESILILTGARQVGKGYITVTFSAQND